MDMWFLVGTHMEACYTFNLIMIMGYNSSIISPVSQSHHITRWCVPGRKNVWGITVRQCGHEDKTRKRFLHWVTSWILFLEYPIRMMDTSSYDQIIKYYYSVLFGDHLAQNQHHNFIQFVSLMASITERNKNQLNICSSKWARNGIWATDCSTYAYLSLAHLLVHLPWMYFV